MSSLPAQLPQTTPDRDDAPPCGHHDCPHPGTIVYASVEVRGRGSVTLDPPANLCPTHAELAWRDGYELFGVIGEPVGRGAEGGVHAA